MGVLACCGNRGPGSFVPSDKLPKTTISQRARRLMGAFPPPDLIHASRVSWPVLMEPGKNNGDFAEYSWLGFSPIGVALGKEADLRKLTSLLRAGGCAFNQ